MTVLTSEAIEELGPGVLAWISGKPLRAIETDLGGNPEADPECPRARYLVSGVVPLGLTFVVGLVAQTAEEIADIADGSTTPRSITDCLPTAIRRGFDTPSKLAFAVFSAECSFTGLFRWRLEKSWKSPIPMTTRQSSGRCERMSAKIPSCRTDYMKSR
jgi:hypothetical protein